MTQALVLLCSPRKKGVSDSAAQLFAQGLGECGMPVRMLALRDYAVTACKGCGVCTPHPHQCMLADTDDAETLFTALATAKLLLIASPIYFYHLPAHFKALIDRSQRFWMQQQACGTEMSKYWQGQEAWHTGHTRPALAILTAGRSCGTQLFKGALLSLNYFLASLGATLYETRQLRGLETVEDLTARPAVTAGLYAWGKDWASLCRACPPC